MVATNTNPKKKVDVLLMGQRFTVRSDRDEKYIDQISRVVNEQLDDIRRNTRTISTHHVALLAALNLADELARTKEALHAAQAAQAQAQAQVQPDTSQLDELKQKLTQKAQATLHEVETALAFLPAEWKGQEG